MKDTLKVTVYSLSVSCDWETGERCGAGGTFQVNSITADTSVGEIDLTDSVDQGKHYESLEKVAKDLELDDVDIEEV